MLPTHVFAEVVGWLSFYDLDALLLTDAGCSDLAHLAASQIRVFDFSEFQFDMGSTEVFIYKPVLLTPERTILNFIDSALLTGFIPDALRNCVVKSLSTFDKHSSDLLKEVAHTIVVKGKLTIGAQAFANTTELVKCAVSFRSVQKVCVFDRDANSGPHMEELVKLFDHHGFGQVDRVRCWITFVNRSA